MIYQRYQWITYKMQYSYFIPLIHLGPFKNYKIIQKLPLESISNIIIGNSAVFEVSRQIIKQNELILKKKTKLEFIRGKWINKKAEVFSWSSNMKKK